MNLRALVSEVRQSVFAVLVDWASPSEGATKIQVLGTAFAISEDLFITADHVANPQNNSPAGRSLGANDKLMLAQIQADGSTAVIIGPYKVISSSQLHDFAILKATSASVRIQKYLELDLGPRFEGEQVAVCGYPLASTHSHPENGAITIKLNIRVAAGIISSQQLQGGSKQLEVDFPILPGNSGGPIFSIASGKVLGLASATLSVGGNGGPTIGHLGIAKDVRNLSVDLKKVS